ncbi:DUF2064 domain-containing protein [Kitasatospora albolonga]|uniref:DUF2064 domain-containing protein n=1 Tax=Kitasatospora albolonga TaxID=68173 RepID=UPI003CD07514
MRQSGGGLDERLAAAFGHARPGAPALLVGMDTPQLDAASLAAPLAPGARAGADAWYGPGRRRRLLGARPGPAHCTARPSTPAGRPDVHPAHRRGPAGPAGRGRAARGPVAPAHRRGRRGERRRGRRRRTGHPLRRPAGRHRHRAGRSGDHHLRGSGPPVDRRPVHPGDPGRPRPALAALRGRLPPSAGGGALVCAARPRRPDAAGALPAPRRPGPGRGLRPGAPGRRAARHRRAGPRRRPDRGGRHPHPRSGRQRPVPLGLRPAARRGPLGCGAAGRRQPGDRRRSRPPCCSGYPNCCALVACCWPRWRPSRPTSGSWCGSRTATAGPARRSAGPGWERTPSPAARRPAGLTETERWTADGRRFTALRRS